MKRIISILLAAVISMSVLCACSSNKNEGDSSSLSSKEQRKILNSNNSIAEFIYSAVNYRVAANYAEGKSIPKPGFYEFEIDREAEDYVYVNQKELGTAITTMTSDETYTFLTYTATHFEDFASNPTDKRWPKHKEGYIVVIIDDTNNVSDVYYSDTEDSEYTGAYPVAPTTVPSYKIDEIPDGEE